MLQNRVDPFGNIIKTKARGAWLGNRGQLHGKGKTILRPFKHQAWIICLLKFKDRRRVIMAPNLWTELFFLDEVTALAAGHRPCFECRRESANHFKQFWLNGNPEYGFDLKTPIGKIDEILQEERIDPKGDKVTFKLALQTLPDGTFIEFKDKPYLLAQQKLYLWTAFGYTDEIDFPNCTDVTVLTPKSIVNVLKAGYLPQIGIDKIKVK